MKDAVKNYLIEYYQERKTTPPQMVIANQFNITIPELRKIFDELVKDGFLTVYFDGKNISSWRLPKKTIDWINALPVKEMEDNKKVNIAKWIIIGICAVMLFIVFNSMKVSIHFSTQQTKTFLDDGTAFCLSLGIVLYISFAPEGAFLLKQMSDKKKMPLIGWLLLFTAIIALFMSMCFTIIGQFNSNSEMLKSNNFDSITALKTEELEIQKRQKSIEDDILFYKNERSNYRQGDKERAVAVSRLDKLEAEHKANNDKLTTNREKQSVSTDKRFNFYTWLAGITGLTSGAIEFIIYIMPALFADLISPLGVSLVVFLLTKFFRKGEEK